MQTKEESGATLISHLDALRSVLLRSLVALAIFFIPLFVASPYILDIFTAEIQSQVGAKLHFFSPMEVFLLQLKISALLDVALCSPYIAWNIWRFVLPALYENEKRFIRRMVWLTGFLFIAGAVFCLVVCFPLIVQFGLSFQNENLQPVFGVSNIVCLALWFSLAFGCMFQFPLVTYALVRSDIVYYETVCHARPYVLIAILVLAALLTPPDILSQLMLGAPTYLLFEAGLLAARRFKGK
ncbi:MAG: twin-arginine translocase subunit TatC [Fibrobacteraceae bacterium]|nr:twin-arginine translocase subunit TatC [Fibrobacteraceae bacterium]